MLRILQPLSNWQIQLTKNAWLRTCTATHLTKNSGSTVRTAATAVCSIYNYLEQLVSCARQMPLALLATYTPGAASRTYDKDLFAFPQGGIRQVLHPAHTTRICLRSRRGVYARYCLPHVRQVLHPAHTPGAASCTCDKRYTRCFATLLFSSHAVTSRNAPINKALAQVSAAVIHVAPH